MVAELNRKYDFEIRVVKKTDFKFMEKFSLPKFPALEIDSKLIFEGRDTTIEEMEEVIRSIQKDYVGL